VSWPLDLIANTESLKKYNKVITFLQLVIYCVACILMALVILLDQVMGFLLKVKRAKFVLDETRKWMWKVLFH
jgi:gamma-tubulin complex component 5